MGQNSKIGESSYSKITTPLSEKEKLQLHYEAVSDNEIKTNKKQEQRLFIYHATFVISIITLAVVKEKFFPSHLGWIEWITQKF